MYDEILLPIDTGPGTEAAVQEVRCIVSGRDAVVHVVHVNELAATRARADGSGPPRDRLNPGVTEVMESSVEAVEDAGAETIETVVDGTAHERLVEYAGEHDVDLVVMGTHGKSALSRMLLGSTAEHVVRQSPAPVLTVRPQAE